MKKKNISFLKYQIILSDTTVGQYPVERICYRLFKKEGLTG